MKKHEQAECQAEIWLSHRVAAMQSGEEVYLPPQMRVAIAGRQHLVMTSSIARRLGLTSGSEANRWRKA